MSTKVTMLVPNTELDIVMPNAHKILNSSMDKLTPLDGHHLQPIQMPEPDNGDLAALRWISGRPTQWLKLTLLIHVPIPLKEERDAKVTSAVQETTDTVESAIKMDVILTHTELVLQISTVQERPSILPSHFKLLPNSSLTMEPTLET